jgi:gluconate 2-dehydrogenase gamma chain
LLQALGLAAAASTFTGFSRWNYAFAEDAMQHHHADAPAKVVHPLYHPQFFSPTEYQNVEILADLILPPTPIPEAKGDATRGKSRMQPGAKQAGVAEFIDFTVFNHPSEQKPFRDGLQWLDGASAPSVSFAKLPLAEQTALLERLAYKAKHRDGEQAGQQFFLLIRRYTVMGYYTTRVGLEALDYPGLTFYGTSPGCTHGDNPEHAGLAEARRGQTA